MGQSAIHGAIRRQDSTMPGYMGRYNWFRWGSKNSQAELGDGDGRVPLFLFGAVKGGLSVCIETCHGVGLPLRA